MITQLTTTAFHATYGPPPPLPAPRGTDFTWGDTLEALLTLAIYAKPRGIIEFGTARGRTSLALARACPGARVLTLDVHACAVPAGAYQECDLRPTDEVGEAFRDTPEAARITQGWVQPTGPHDVEALAAHGPFDFAFVDSLHSYEGVLRDTEAAFALVGRDRPGIIVWDDFMSAGVPRLLKEVAETRQVIHVENTRMCFAVVGIATHGFRS